ncbi:MAG: fibronectin type III domain-containing protein [Firmicutes bacterium]|nr:fibronectin type III domain-containing protein [Bacillota bacterium]
MKKYIVCFLTLCLALTLALGTVSVGYAAEQEELNEPTEQEEVKIDISEYTVELDSYLVLATGEPFTPQVTNVSLEDKDTLKPEDYEVSYYKVLNFEKEEFEPTDEIREIGEYKVAVIGKGEYCGEAYSLFTVVGKQQHLTLEKTRYALKMGAEPITLRPKTDGDGTGFEFQNFTPDVIKVSDAGNVKILKAGRAVVIVSTCGDKLYQPAGATVVFEISPAKVSWDKKEMAVLKKKVQGKTQIAWNKAKGATKYEIEYSADSKFKNSKTIKVSASKDSASLKKLKAGRTYYVRTRALTEIKDARGNKKTLEGPWSSTLKIKK